MKKAIKVFIYLTLVALILVGAVICWYFAVTANTVFDDSKLKKFEQSFTVYDSSENVIEQKRSVEYVTADKLPSHVKNAFIAVEDKRFYSHHGIDMRAILRAIKNNVLSFSFKEGASTISQQLVKNTFLSGDKTITRKMKEIKLTKILESKYGKDEILEMYLNTVYFGEGSYGIGAAAEKYFGVKAEDLTVSQAATLAGLVKSPSYYDPFKNYENSLSRRNLVLDIMADENYIITSDIKTYKNEEIILNYDNNYKNEDKTLDSIVDEALTLLHKNKLSDLNGYKIYTSLDRNLSRGIPTPNEYGIQCDYSAIVIDNKYKTIIAAASDVGEISRCPASAAKPWLLYAPAIEEKYITEATKIDDSITDFNGYVPTNYGNKYYGFTSVKDCLTKSLNVPAVKIASGFGIDKIVRYAKKMNIEFQNEDLSIALGNLSGGITLRQLAGAYLPFSSDGYYYKPTIIEKIVNPKGKTVYKKSTESVKVFSSGTAFIINDILYETAKSGTAKKLGALGFDVCAKTGTNGDENGNIDAYCIAYTPEYTVAVWLGNRDFSALDNSVSGGTYPTSIAADIISTLYKSGKPTKFSRPNDVLEVKIDKKSYEDGKIYLSGGEDKDGIGFYFLSGTEPKSVATMEVKPYVKDYKIICLNNVITIDVEVEKGTYYKIYEGENILFDSKENEDTFVYETKNKRAEYNFYLVPYSEINGVTKEGDKIKLPTVKTEGKDNKRITELPWWEYD